MRKVGELCSEGKKQELEREKRWREARPTYWHFLCFDAQSGEISLLNRRRITMIMRKTRCLLSSPFEQSFRGIIAVLLECRCSVLCPPLHKAQAVRHQTSCLWWKCENVEKKVGDKTLEKWAGTSEVFAAEVSCFVACGCKQETLQWFIL